MTCGCRGTPRTRWTRLPEQGYDSGHSHRASRGVMLTVTVVLPDSPVFAEVKRLWSANRKTLGFLPDGAFAERAQSGQILAAIDGEVVLGYLLFFTKKTTNTVELNHLCVDESGRGKGIARALVEHLRSTTKKYYGISLSCRRDFDACSLWPKLGFVAVGEFNGRAGILTRFLLRHAHPTLLDSTGANDQRLHVVIDSNIVFDLEMHPDRGRRRPKDLLRTGFSLTFACVSPRRCSTIFTLRRRGQEGEEFRRGEVV